MILTGGENVQLFAWNLVESRFVRPEVLREDGLGDVIEPVCQLFGGMMGCVVKTGIPDMSV